MLWNKVTLVGIGLLGGSLGLALRKRGLARHTCGLVRRRESIQTALDLKLVDDATLDHREAAKDADLLVFCTPVSQMAELYEKLAPSMDPGTCITDVGSVKTLVVQSLEPCAVDNGHHFIGSHPMAGAEASGPFAAREDLFENALTVITPTPLSNRPALQKIEETWSGIGCRLLKLQCDQHDQWVARTSHLPHLIASELARYALAPCHPAQQKDLCATGFRDTTRIASGSPEMWKDIVMANRSHLAPILGDVIKDLEKLQTAIQSEDDGFILDFLNEAKSRRDRLYAAPAQ